MRARGSGAARIYDAAGRIPAGLRELRIAIYQLPGGQRPAVCQSRGPDDALPESAGLRPLRSADRRSQLTRQSWLLAYPPYLKPEFERLRCNRRGCFVYFSCVVDTLPKQCLRRRPAANFLVATVFRTKRLRYERCSATCQRRRRPGQARRRQGRLQIAADMAAELWTPDISARLESQLKKR